MTDDKLPEDLAGAAGGTDDDDVLRRAAREIRGSQALSALVPLSSAEREQLADQAIERATGQAIGQAMAAVIPLRRRRAAVIAVAAAGLALAAGVAIYVRTARVAPLPTYAMVVAGEQRTRGAAADAGPVALRRETHLVITLSAQQPERDALLRLVLVRDGRATLLDPAITRRSATLEIAGSAAELLGAASDGPGELVVVLGRALPGDDEIRALALGGAAPPALQILRRAIVLEGFSHTAIDTLLGGCRAVLGGAPPRCEIAAGAPLRLWVGVADARPITLALDDHPVAPAATARGGGAAFAIDARPGTLVVRVADRVVATWQLAPAASFAEVGASDQARKAGRLAEAAADLDGVPPGASAEEQLEVVRRRAKLARLRGDPGERGARERAVALARSLGRISVESDETVAILYGLMDGHALSEAARLLPALDAHGMTYAEGAVHRDLVHGMLASELGDLGVALGSFQRALATADRIADAADRAAILGPLADVLQSLGRGGEASALIDAEIQRGADDGDVCARVDGLTNAGWLLRDRDPGRAQQLVDQAAGLAVERCAHRLPIALVNQGWLLAATRRFAEARAVLDRLARIPAARDGRVTTWALRLEAETLLGEDPAKAAAHAEHLAARAAALCSTELAYEAHLLHARALVLLDRPAEAAAAFAEAERALTVWSRLVPLGEGRDTFFERHDQLALTAIPFFLAQARRGAPGAERALAATVRRSLARFVTSLAAGARAEHGEAGRDQLSRQFERTLDRWPGTTADPEDGVCQARDVAALAAPARLEPPAQDALFVHPAPHGLVVVAWRRSGIAVRTLAPEQTAQPGQTAQIVEAAAAMLAGTTRVQLHVHRSLAALPLDRSLAARLAVPVAFAVDAPPGPPRPPGARCHGERRALLVTNPQRNLWAASDAAGAIQRDLAHLGFSVDTLDGPAATRAAVTARLADPCTAVFHYDGHGAAAGGDRSDDALLLAGGELLTAADVLGLARVPAAVVLNGCTTAAPEGLGLAQAFLLAGATQVIASLDDVPADAAARFTRALYAGAPPGGLDLVPLFARATAAGDVPALRVFER
ncbi:MAG TPA: CHAT domain-containing protein [Kofleriaceae bacterium]|jgi:tetratricopeptide (TPR) repeat protein|nr:CHAT domain-containing protein [Kofleriaceae bacterium]